MCGHLKNLKTCPFAYNEGLDVFFFNLVLAHSVLQ